MDWWSGPKKNVGLFCVDSCIRKKEILYSLQGRISEWFYSFERCVFHAVKIYIMQITPRQKILEKDSQNSNKTALFIYIRAKYPKKWVKIPLKMDINKMLQISYPKLSSLLFRPNQATIQANLYKIYVFIIENRKARSFFTKKGRKMRKDSYIILSEAEFQKKLVFNSHFLKNSKNFPNFADFF